MSPQALLRAAVAPFTALAPLAVLALGAAALLALAPAHLARAADGPAAFQVQAATLSADGRTLVLEGAGDDRRYPLRRWRAWAAEHLDEQVPGELRIGPRTVRADDFERFGAAFPAPDGDRVLFSVTTYAVATTLSLIGVIEPDGADPIMMPEPRLGEVEEAVWTRDQRRVAYVLGTARGRGQSLHVDHVAERRSGFSLAWREMHRAWSSKGAPAPAAAGGDPGPDLYQPGFRDLAWNAAGTRLSFRVDLPGASDGDAPAGPGAVAGMRWSVAADGSDLRPASGPQDR